MLSGVEIVRCFHSRGPLEPELPFRNKIFYKAKQIKLSHVFSDKGY